MPAPCGIFVVVLTGRVCDTAGRGALALAEIVPKRRASGAILALDDRPGRGRDLGSSVLEDGRT